jgi:FdrA protein
MSVVLNRVRRGFYVDSVSLMRIAQGLQAMPGVEEAGLMIGTPSNRGLLREAGVLDALGEAAGPGDLVIAVRAATGAAAEAALAAAAAAIDARHRSGAATPGSTGRRPLRSLRSARAAMPEATLALISVPGDFAAAEAMKALAAGLDVMVFSDNVPLADEIALKRQARAAGRLIMGPDCGTAIIAGVPLGFANVVPLGPIGIVGASGTGIQEVSSLIARAGGGISHAIGTGGRDLESEVGGITTLMAIDLLDADPATRHIVLVSKPPAADVARAVLARVALSPKPFTVCFLGAGGLSLPANARPATTLEAAAAAALGRPVGGEAPLHLAQAASGGRLMRGLFAGGTLCAEAQIVALEAGVRVASNVPVPGAAPIEGDTGAGHTLLDLGDDAYTRGRPHPMLEPAVRDGPLAMALADPRVGVVLLDVVLGTGAHRDPAGHLVRVLAAAAARRPHVVASVTGTDGDPQGLSATIAALREAGIVVAPSNAAAARAAFAGPALCAAS